MKILPNWIRTGLALLSVIAFMPAPRAQEYPTRPLRVITANSAGGTSDIFVRAHGRVHCAGTGRAYSLHLDARLFKEAVENTPSECAMSTAALESQADALHL